MPLMRHESLSRRKKILTEWQRQTALLRTLPAVSSVEVTIYPPRGFSRGGFFVDNLSKI